VYPYDCLRSGPRSGAPEGDDNALQGDNTMLLVGDVGGTKIDLAVFSRTSGPRAPVAEAVYPSARYSGLAEVARDFLASNRLTVDRACFAVAGPVQDGRASLTNLPWVIDEAVLSRELGLREVRLLNDLEAMA
jgi:glucokinase